ncbi:MAG TPA: hypothetical protein V6C91_17860 [Coleofasciculaceae cyanobacterium]
MSPSVNRYSDSPKSSGVQPPEAHTVPEQSPTVLTDDSQDVTNNSAENADSSETTPSDIPSDIQRQQPIPPPSEPMQYRAIGLVRGQYMPSAEQLTRGTLVAADGTLIDAVLLGRVMSLVKNHISLEQSHLWVVYPRSRQEDGNLHVQIVGVWEPEKLNRTSPTEPPTLTPEEEPEQPEEETPPELSQSEDIVVPDDGYFSIRGEVIYHAREIEQVIVKIRQSPRKESDKIKFFKLKLQGSLGDKRAVGRFWDLHILLQGNTLAIQAANDIGMLPAKKRGPGGGKRFNKKRPPTKGKKNFANQRPTRPGERPAPASSAPPKRKDPLPKPVKRSEPNRGGNSPGNSSS